MKKRAPALQLRRIVSRGIVDASCWLCSRGLQCKPRVAGKPKPTAQYQLRRSYWRLKTTVGWELDKETFLK